MPTWLSVLLFVLIGLAIFLAAVESLSNALRSLASDKLSGWLRRFTSTGWSAVLVGTGVTMLLDSSSAVIILTIVLVNSGMMPFRNALGVVLGANIGTTFSSQLVALDVGAWSAVPLLAGIVLQHAGRSVFWRSMGSVVFSFGLLFAGLFIMGHAVEPFKDDPALLTWLHGLEHPLKGALIGGLITLVVQSSSATVAMAITLCSKSMLSLPAGVAVMLGAELGTCSDTLLATVKSDRNGLKVGVFHLLFNLISIIVGLLLIGPFLDVVDFLAGELSVAKQVGIAHLLFNMAGVLVALPFLDVLANGLDRLLPSHARTSLR
jgi:phosphate:Na+ symporter